MLTRCPHCETAFRVTSEQLKARQGRVRCGACQGVFDALDSLADEVPPVVAGVPESELEPASELLPEPEQEPVPEPATEPEPEPEPESEPEEESRPPQDGDDIEVSAAPAKPADEPDLPEEWVTPPSPAPARRWPWAIGVLLLLALGAGQLLYYFRVELAVTMPALRPTLVAACEMAGCTVPYPRKPELAGIESSDLAPAGDERLLLTATLKNRAPFAQEYPHLELTLTDTHDAPLLRKVLTPADWLPAGQDAAAGFPVRGEVAVKLLLEAPGVPAAGYRLYLFYP